MLRISTTSDTSETPKRRAWNGWATRALALLVAVTTLVTAPVVAANAADAPSSTSAVPGSDNTGVPAGITLTKYYGDLTITKDGTVINGLEIFGLVRVEAANVVIKNSIIRGRKVTSNSGLIWAGSTKTVNLIVQDTELVPTYPSAYINGIYGHHFTLRRVDIHGVIDSVHIFGDKVRVFNSYLHNNLHYANDPTWNGGPSHDDNVQIQKGYDIWIADNNISGAVNSAMQVTQGQGVTQKILYERNRVAGGACTLNITQVGRVTTPIHNINIRNNVFGTSNANCNVIIDNATRKYTVIENNTRTDGRAVKVMLR